MPRHAIRVQVLHRGQRLRPPAPGEPPVVIDLTDQEAIPLIELGAIDPVPVVDTPPAAAPDPVAGADPSADPSEAPVASESAPPAPVPSARVTRGRPRTKEAVL